jgi:hypothetical protein
MFRTASQSESVPIRVVEVVRDSTDAQVSNENPQAQRDWLDRKRVEWPTPEEVIRIDPRRGVSGTLAAADRPDMRELQRLADQGLLKGAEIRFRFTNRATRHPDPMERAWVMSLALRYGVTKIRTSEGDFIPQNVMHQTMWIMATGAAAQDNTERVEKTMDGKVRFAREGKLVGRAPYGLGWRAEDGWTVPATDEEEAALVQKPKMTEGEVKRIRVAREQRIAMRIVEELESGKSGFRISEDLTKEKIPTPASDETHEQREGKKKPLPTGKWTSAMVLRIASSPHLKGEIVWKTYDPESTKKVNGRKPPKKNWVVQETFTIKCPALISEERWKKLQKLLDENSNAGRPALPEMKALLRRVAVCAHCGSPIYVDRSGDSKIPSYVCSRFKSADREKEWNCRTRHGHVDEVDEKVKDVIRRWLDERDIIGRGVRRETDVRAALAQARLEVKKLEKKEGDIIDLMTEGKVTKSVASRKLDAIKAERREVQAKVTELERLKSNEAERIQSAEQMEREITALKKAVASDEFETWAKLVRLVAREALRGKFQLASDGGLSAAR